jgi:hypothetical protein
VQAAILLRQFVEPLRPISLIFFAFAMLTADRSAKERSRQSLVALVEE